MPINIARQSELGTAYPTLKVEFIACWHYVTEPWDDYISNL